MSVSLTHCLLSAQLALDSSQTLELLLRFVLSPEHFGLRKSFEWLGDALSRTTALSSALVQNAVGKACGAVLSKALQELSSPGDTAPRRSLSPADQMRWVHSLNTMSLLDRDVPWLDSDTTVDEERLLEPSWPLVPELGRSALFTFVQVSLLIFMDCASAVLSMKRMESNQATSDNSLGGDAHIHAAAAVTRHADCAAEVMRVMNMVLKARRKAYVSSEGQYGDMWSSLVNAAMPVASELLASRVIGKVSMSMVRLSVSVTPSVTCVTGRHRIDCSWDNVPAVDMSPQHIGHTIRKRDYKILSGERSRTAGAFNTGCAIALHRLQ